MQGSFPAMTIDRPNFQGLAGDIGGQVILPEDADFEVARRVWNGMIDKRPLGIVRCISHDDVMASIAFAAGNGIAAAVRGGGHNIAGNATRDRGLVPHALRRQAQETWPQRISR
jgi:hypothetical protein